MYKGTCWVTFIYSFLSVTMSVTHFPSFSCFSAFFFCWLQLLRKRLPWRPVDDWPKGDCFPGIPTEHSLIISSTNVCLNVCSRCVIIFLTIQNFMYKTGIKHTHTHTHTNNIQINVFIWFVIPSHNIILPQDLIIWCLIHPFCCCTLQQVMVFFFPILVHTKSLFGLQLFSSSQIQINFLWYNLSNSSSGSNYLSFTIAYHWLQHCH